MAEGAVSFILALPFLLITAHTALALEWDRTAQIGGRKDDLS